MEGITITVIKHIYMQIFRKKEVIVMKKDDVVIEENTEKKVEQTKPFLNGLAILLISLISILFPPWYLLIVPIFLLVLWFIWAPSMIMGIFIPEGYAVIICRGQENGSFVKAMANYKGYNIDEKGRVVEDNNVKKWALGIKFFWWPFDRVYSYSLEWKQYSQNEEVVHRKERLYRVLLKLYAYLIEVDDAEDKDKVPQKLRVVVPMQVIDVYKAAFKVQNWYRIVSNVIVGDLRDFIRTKSYEELISSSNQNLNEMIGARLKLLAPTIEENYGVKNLLGSHSRCPDSYSGRGILKGYSAGNYCSKEC